MDTLKKIGDNQSVLLSELSKANIIRQSDEYVATIIAPPISEADAIIGRFACARKPREAIADQLGEDMNPNFIDISAFGALEYQVQDHELHAKVGNNKIKRLVEAGYTEQDALEIFTAELTETLRAGMETEVLSAVAASGNYASGMTAAATSNRWSTVSNDPRAQIGPAMDALEAMGAPTGSVYIVASPSVWSALRKNTALLGTRVDGLRPFASYDDLAFALGGSNCHAVVARQQLNGAYVMGDNVALVCRPESVNSASRCSWRLAFGGSQDGNPNPIVTQYYLPGLEHRGPCLGCRLDRQLLATGANDAGKQIWSYLITDTLA